MEQYSVIKKIISKSSNKKIIRHSGLVEYFFFISVGVQLINGQKLALLLRFYEENVAVYIDDPDTPECNGYSIHPISWLTNLDL